MRIFNSVLVGGFLVAGTLPWYSLGPASTLGVPGWGSGVAAVLTVVAGAGAAVLSHLADKGMPTKSGSIGPRFGAGLLALVSLVSVITWLCLSGNNQAVIGNESVPLYLGPGAPVTAILSTLTVIMAGYELTISPEKIPASLADAYAKATTTFNTSKKRQGVSNNKRVTRQASTQEANRSRPVPKPVPPAGGQAPAAMANKGSRQSTDVLVPPAPSVQPPKQGPKRPPAKTEGGTAATAPIPTQPPQDVEIKDEEGGIPRTG